MSEHKTDTSKGITSEAISPRGRPRSSEIRTGIHQAFLQAMLEEGYSNLSIDAIAKRAGISRTTIYRWYKDRDEIALEVAIELVNQPEFPPPSGDYAQDIRAFFETTFEGANSRGPLFTALMARAQSDRQFADRVWASFSQPRREYLARIIQQGYPTDGGSNVSLETLLDMIFGAIWYRMMSGHAPLDGAFVEELCLVVDGVLAQ